MEYEHNLFVVISDFPHWKNIPKFQVNTTRFKENYFRTKNITMSEGAKQRLSIVIDLAKTVFHYGFIPTVLYLGNYIIKIFI